jgi:transcriptional regulator of nitric oxide reductase
LLGFVASTWKVAGSVGYSGKPVDVLLAISPEGQIKAAKLLEQTEPILTIGISPDDIAAFVGSFQGQDVLQQTAATDSPTAIAGATVSSGVIRDGIVRTARAVLQAQSALADQGQRKLDLAGFTERTWGELTNNGSIVNRRIAVAEARTLLGEEVYEASGASDDAPFAELYVGVLSPPAIGQNLLGKQVYTALVSSAPPEAAIIFVAGNGLYSFKGTQWKKSGVFDRIELLQGDKTIKLTSNGYHAIDDLKLADAPEFRELAAFFVPPESGFDPVKSWRLSLLAMKEQVLGATRTGAFEVKYQVPGNLIIGPAEQSATGVTVAEGEEFSLWQSNWLQRKPAIAALGLMLTVLVAILIFQDILVRWRTLYNRVRFGFLLTTFLVLGLGLGAQLSVVHVLTFAQALRTGFQWETFLLDPLVFILWSFVAAALLFWGRGVFCGWLCPFGALQELMNAGAQRLGVRQIEVPFGLHERLWPIKYIVFLALFALSLGSITYAFTGAEIEPFKTVITMKLARSWPFVLFACALLLAGLFIERFYCRYLCPLGAALGIPARLRMFEWLKRRHQCGRECRICAVRCTVQAIHPDGHINPNECIYCLKCQANYFDDQTCPPLKVRRQRTEALAGRSAGRGGGSDG